VNHEYDGLDLLSHHAKLLSESGITPEIAAARGYRTVTEKKNLEELGFGVKQRRVPALLIPIHNVRGEVALHQLRPDEPRRDKGGKALKYETPAGASMSLDVPPIVRQQLDDPSVPLFITEGARKADAAASVGLCCVSLLGVWNFRGKNDKGGKVVLPDLEYIAFNARPTYICFDSDVMEKTEVSAALSRLGMLVSSRGAHLSYIYLPSGEGGAKVGLDDYLADGHSIDDLLSHASKKIRQPMDAEDESKTIIANILALIRN
jgi:hypothetical protein